MKIYWSAKFFAFKRTTHREKGLELKMRFTLRGQKPLDFSLQLKVDLADWDAVAMQAKAGATDADEINRTINTWRAAISEVMSRYEIIEKRIPSRGEVKDLFNDLVGRNTSLKDGIGDNMGIEFYPCFDLFVETMGKKNQWTKSTFEKFTALKRHLQAFDPTLSFHNISERKMQRYLDHLTEIGMRNTTISKHLAFFRWFVRWAYLNGYYSGHIHETFRPKLKGVSGDKEIIYLAQDEVRRLQDMEFQPSDKALEHVRDVFLFCCFTGLRYSDVAKLKRTDIKTDHIEVITKKTVDALIIELNKHSRAILAKYADVKFKGDLALPVICNVKMNHHLKDLGKMAGLDDPTRIVYFNGNRRIEEVKPKWQLLTTHAARRTFVVTALQLGIPAEVIMRWTGHSRYEAMKPYIAIVDELKRISMSKFDTL